MIGSISDRSSCRSGLSLNGCLTVAATVTLALLGPAALSAQEEPGWEVGTRAGLGLVMNGGELLSFGVPGAGPSPLSSLLGGTSSVHFAFHPSDQLMVEPQFNLSILNFSNGSSETVTTLGLTGQLAYLPSGTTESSPYVGFNGGFFRISNGTSESDLAVGANVGYRIPVSEGAVVRLEGAYRRWIDFEVNEINAAFILGVLFD